ncbi:c-type cytochrome [Chitinimonas sp. PSY-7]|uniref:c-type cytochrome n=1 Tax=Chitinimonas sp. PSY-7 TaxID=3459088 RepID=UPI00403FE875
MSEAQAESGMSAKGLIGIILAAIIGIPLFIYLVIKVATGGMVLDAGSPSMTNEAVIARVQPVGYSKLDDSGPPGSRNGKAVYENICASCHAAGLAGAPKFSDTAAWGARISKGFATLVEHAVKGFNAMPAKGGAADLTDDEVARAVAYLGNAGGGKFTEPPIAGGAAGGKADPAAKGKEIYDTVCMACHASGLAGAPKFGDKADWASRLKEGVDAAIKIGIAGKGAMPPKGGYQGSDEEFHAAAEYMINAAK